MRGVSPEEEKECYGARPVEHQLQCIPQASTGQGLQNGGLFVLVLERSCYDGKDLQKMKVGIEKHRVNRAVGDGPGSADE